jgi:hypothetical protein
MKYIIQKSTRKNKKYMVFVDGKMIHFGDTRYQHYEDKTYLKLYSNLNHYDEERQNNYKKRHNKTRHKLYSASWFSDNYLW